MHTQNYEYSIEGPTSLDLSSKPTIRDLMTRVAMKTLDKWLEMGIQLGLEAAQIRAIASQHRGESAKIFMDIFDYWERQPGEQPKTWSTIIEVLKTPLVGESSLASDIELMCTTPNPSTNTNM